MPIEVLDKLQYSEDRSGPFRLYVFGMNGYHTGGQWFAKKIKYPDEEITVERAKNLADEAIAEGREVRITDGGDMLVYHSRTGRVLYPESGDFWEEIR